MAQAHAMRMGMQGQQVYQQPQGWECLALSRDSESAEIAHVGVTVGFFLSVPLLEPATSSLAPLGVIMTFRRHRRSDRVRNWMPGTCDWDAPGGYRQTALDAGVTDAVKSPEGQRGAGPS